MTEKEPFNAKKARGKRPCPIWVDAFHRDTQMLCADEIGAYIMIIMAMWTRETCDFPDDDMRLARVSKVSSRLWKSRVGPAIRPFLISENGVLTSKKLREEAAFVERFLQAQSDRKNGTSPESSTYAEPQGAPDFNEENAENSDNSLKNNKVALSTDNSTDKPPTHPTQQPNNPTLDDGGGSAGARSEILPDEPTPRERLLAAMGLTSGLTATGRMLGNPGDMAEAQRWAKMDLTLDQQCDVIRELMAKKRDGPPSSFRYFTEAMRRRAGELNAPPLQPIHSEHRKATQNERNAFDHAIHETAKRLSDGSVALETASRDPFAVRRG